MTHADLVRLILLRLSPHGLFWSNNTGVLRDRTDRPGRPERRPRREGDAPLATYRIAVGKRHKVEPRQIVGALANEGGLKRGDFGAITIKPDFSLVELPANLPAVTYQKLADTRISGKLIDLRRDDGPPRKPRHKH